MALALERIGWSNAAFWVRRLEESVKDLKPQLGRTEKLAEDLKQQVELLRRDYREIAEVLSGR